MDNIFSTNSYYLLGLRVSATQNEIKKKASLISAQLGIGEIALSSDFPSILPDRTEDSLKDAVQRLSNPVRKIQEAYFWYSDEDLDACSKLIINNKIDEAYHYFSNQAEQKGKWNSKRGFVLYLTQLLYSQKAYKKYLKKSLDLWQEILSVESSWKYFKLYYMNIVDLNTHESAFSTLRPIVDQTISDIYSQLSEKWDDSEYTQLYTKMFGKIGAHIQVNILSPRTKEINTAVKELNSFKWQNDSPSVENLSDLKKNIGLIQQALNALIEANLYDEPDVIVLRDKASDAIRGVAIDMTNNYKDYERSAQILAMAEEISGTQSTKRRNQNDKNNIEENRIVQKFQLPILELLRKGKSLDAVEYIKHLITLNEGNSKELKVLQIQLTYVMARYITETRSEAMAKINKRDFTGAISLLEGLRRYIATNMDQFNLNKEEVEVILNNIDQKTGIINKNIFDELTAERDVEVKKIYENLGDTPEADVIMSLMDCSYFIPLGKFLKINTSKNQTISTLYFIGWCTVMVYGIGLLFLIAAYIWENSEVKYVRE